MTLADAGFPLYLPVEPGLSLAVGFLDVDAVKAGKDLAVAHARSLGNNQITDSYILHKVANTLGFQGGWGALKASLDGPLVDFRSSYGGKLCRH